MTPYLKKIKIVTDYPLALDSPDYQMPHGTRQGNARNYYFKEKLCRLYPEKILRVMDIGCGGGGFVRDIIDDGNIAIGLDGSDWSEKMQRAEWGVITKFLFTCDITKSFTVLEGDETMVFDVITAFEVMEHIATSDIQSVLKNVRKHINEKGLFIASISTKEDVINGFTLHQTVKPKEWWVALLRGAGFYEMSEYYKFFGKHYVCWSPNSFNLVLSTNPLSAPAIPATRFRKMLFEKWSGSLAQKTLQRVINGF